MDVASYLKNLIKCIWSRLCHEGSNQKFHLKTCSFVSIFFIHHKEILISINFRSNDKSFRIINILEASKCLYIFLITPTINY